MSTASPPPPDSAGRLVRRVAQIVSSQMPARIFAVDERVLFGVIVSIVRNDVENHAPSICSTSAPLRVTRRTSRNRLPYRSAGLSNRCRACRRPRGRGASHRRDSDRTLAREVTGGVLRDGINRWSGTSIPAARAMLAYAASRGPMSLTSRELRNLTSQPSNPSGISSSLRVRFRPRRGQQESWDAHRPRNRRAARVREEGRCRGLRGSRLLRARGHRSRRQRRVVGTAGR